MGKFFVTLTLLLAIVIGAAVFALNQFAAPEIKEAIESEGGKAIEGRVHVAGVKIVLWPPVAVELTGVTVGREKKPKTEVNAPQVLVRVNPFQLLFKRIAATVILKSPKGQISLPANALNSLERPQGSELKKAKKYPADLRFPGEINVVVDNGDLEALVGADHFHAKNLKMRFELSDVKDAAHLAAQTLLDINMGSFKTAIPIEVDSAFHYTDQTFQTPRTTISLNGLEGTLKGSVHLPSNAHAWQLDIDLPDLKSFSTLPGFLPEGKWAGTIKSLIRVEKKKDEDWTASGNIKVLDLRGSSVTYKTDKQTFDGDFQMSSEVDFNYDGELKVDKAYLQSEMKDLGIHIAGQLDKPRGTPFHLDLKSVGANNTIYIQPSTLTFANISATAEGKIRMTSLFGSGGAGAAIQSAAIKPTNGPTNSNAPLGPRESELLLRVPRTSLAGLEKYFPPLATSPLTGTVQVEAYARGDLKDPKTMIVELNPLSLENVKGTLKWASADKTKKLEGPVLVDGRVILATQGAAIRVANIKGHADLTQLRLAMGDDFQKKAGSALTVDLNANQRGRSIEIVNSAIKSSMGPVVIKGTIENPQEPRLNLRFLMVKMNLMELGKLSPIVNQRKLSGFASADLGLKGTYDFSKGIEKSPLALTGKINAGIPQFIFRSTPKAARPEPLLPSWPIIETMKVSTNVKINKLGVDNLVLTGVEWDGDVSNGSLRGGLKIKNIFSGTLNVEKIDYNLLDPTPTAHFTAQAGNTDVAQALAWIAPEWKGLAAGRATGNVTMQSSKASGSLKIAGGFLSSLPFDKVVNEKLQAIPGIGKKQTINSKGVAGDITTDFNFHDGQLDFKSLHMTTPEHNEMQVAGWVKLDQSVDLKGQVFLANAAVQPMVLKNNSDGKGRLKLDVHFDGSVFRPDLHLVETTLKQVLANTASGEVNRAKEQAVKHLGDEAQKKLRNLFGE